jgi:L-rhamnose mutarotase
MKNILYALVILVLIGCDDSTGLQTRNFSFLIDRTEANANFPKPEYLLRKLPNRNPDDALSLCFATIGDTRYTQSRCFVLGKGKTGLLANDYERKQQWELLEQKFSDSLALENHREHHYDRSDIFRTVVAELDKLSKSGGVKELWLFSDLKEHSFFSVYDPHDQRTLFQNMDRVVQRFEKEMKSTNDWSGIRVRIVHSPDREQEAVFTQMLEVYRRVLEPKGVMIQIGLQDQITIE